MRRLWRVALPAAGLILFGMVSYQSYERDRAERKYLEGKHSEAPRRYFYWSYMQLDRYPESERAWTATPCGNGRENCVQWDLTVADRWIEPSAATKVLLCALPALIFSGLAVTGLGRLGVNEVWSFTVIMPVAIAGWLYFVGWLLERWVEKRFRRANSQFPS